LFKFKSLFPAENDESLLTSPFMPIFAEPRDMSVLIGSVCAKLLRPICIGLIIFLALPFDSPASVFTRSERSAFQKSIIDYRKRINPHFRKIKRKKTRYIVVHTSECNRKSTLRTVSKGKRLRNGRRTYGGHAHYVIDRSGRTYRILHKRYRADHAGKSMWNGQTDLSNVSIGIELVGYHYNPLTKHQYRSVGLLIDILKNVYHLKDMDILTHCQIAYGTPNRWNKHNHRGRKRCAKNFSRHKAGLGPTWPYDPDVKSGRLVADAHLSAIFYTRKRVSEPTRFSHRISKSNSAWAIAGEDYKSQATIYRFPDGRLFSGEEIDQGIGWERLPPNTTVLLNQQNIESLYEQKGPIKTIFNGLSAWSFAGSNYNRPTTIYFLPNGQFKNGRAVSDWDELPEKTRLIIGYRGPYRITSKQNPRKIAGNRYNHPTVLYYYPSYKLIAGNKIQDFRKLPTGTLLFLPVK
jgi:N-acetyl-anhydromuramyl-L-alanine amidase AmpD